MLLLLLLPHQIKDMQDENETTLPPNKTVVNRRQETTQSCSEILLYLFFCVASVMLIRPQNSRSRPRSLHDAEAENEAMNCGW